MKSSRTRKTVISELFLNLSPEISVQSRCEASEWIITGLIGEAFDKRLRLRWIDANIIFAIKSPGDIMITNKDDAEKALELIIDFILERNIEMENLN